MADPKILLSINRCPHHGLWSISVDCPEQSSGLRLTHGKCCGSWTTVKSWEVNAADLAAEILKFAGGVRGRSTPAMTIFECRYCSASTGHVACDADPPALGWSRVAHVDGPNAICPLCIAEAEAVGGLHEDGYPNAAVMPVTDPLEVTPCG